MKKVGRSLERGERQCHRAHADHCPALERQRRWAGPGSSLPLPLSLPETRSLFSQGPPLQFLLLPSLRPSHCPHPMLSRQNQASAMSPTAHRGNCRDGGQIRWWRGREALRFTQNIPSAFSNHSWSTYSFCIVGWAAEAVPDWWCLGGTQEWHLPPQPSATPPTGPLRGGPSCDPLSQSPRRGLVICALPLSWSQRWGSLLWGTKYVGRTF